MTKRESHKDIALSGRTWRIRKFDPLMGSFVATRLIGKIGTILASVAGGAVSSEAAIATAVSEAIGSFPKAEFMELQLDALSVVGEVTALNGTEVVLPVKLASGAWGVEGLNDDLLTVMALVTHSLIFNISPFFDGGALKSVMTSFQGLTLFNAQT
jgi:tail assembly chaperone